MNIPEHYIEENGVIFAGHHFLLDIFNPNMDIDDIEYMAQVLRGAVDAANATLLHIHVHSFVPYSGLSGVAVLEESHISVHTWPENGYAAFDVFMCGNANVRAAVDYIIDSFQPSFHSLKHEMRGILHPHFQNIESNETA